MQILTVFRIFQMQELWKMVAISAVQCLVKYSVRFYRATQLC